MPRQRKFQALDTSELRKVTTRITDYPNSRFNLATLRMGDGLSVNSYDAMTNDYHGI
jgi:hypothetical protein